MKVTTEPSSSHMPQQQQHDSSRLELCQKELPVSAVTVGFRNHKDPKLQPYIANDKEM